VFRPATGSEKNGFPGDKPLSLNVQQSMALRFAQPDMFFAYACVGAGQAV
jgi:hypothetical protein